MLRFRVTTTLIKTTVRAVAVIFLASFAGLSSARDMVVVVSDGDSLKIDGERLRLWGIDAPELGQRCECNGQPFDCGRAAKDQLGKLVSGGAVECAPVERDRYGRTVARCSLGGLDLAAEMVRSGWALDYRRYSHGAYSREEQEAREAGRGLWGGSFQPPWEWRH